MNTPILRPAEWVLPGHPDKLADAIADALVQAAFERQAEALCAIEVALHRETVYLTGRLACTGSHEIDIPALVRSVYASAGYGDDWRPAPADITVGGNLCIDTLVAGEERIRHISDDQSIVTGYAIDLPGIGYIAPEQWLARELARRLSALVRSPLRLCPDGKVLVIVEEEGERRRLKAVSVLAARAGGRHRLQRAVVQTVDAVVQDIALRVPSFEAALPQDIVVNGSGTYATGGPRVTTGSRARSCCSTTTAARSDWWHRAQRQGLLEAGPGRHALGAAVALAVVPRPGGCAQRSPCSSRPSPGDEAPRFVRINACPDATCPMRSAGSIWSTAGFPWRRSGAGALT